MTSVLNVYVYEPTPTNIHEAILRMYAERLFETLFTSYYMTASSTVTNLPDYMFLRKVGVHFHMVSQSHF